VEFKDQMNQIVRLETVPRRIISLVPSQTELLHDIGLEEEVVGITKFCIFPERWFHTKNRVGGPKKLDIEKIKALQPDLILANKEENIESEINELKQFVPVWVSDIETLQQANEMILTVGEMVGKSAESQKIVREIEANFSQLKHKNKWTCLYFLWKDPYMVAGNDTFITEMIRYCGGINLQQANRYPVWEFPEDVEPDVVLLSSEPYPFEQKHVAFFQEKYPNSKIILVEGEFFCWYGSRLRNVPAYFEEVNAIIQHS